MIRTLLKPLSFIPAILLMYMIFSFSAQEGTASSSVSYQASVKVVKAVDLVFDLDLEEWQISNYATRFNGPIRKAAHMGEYFLLAIAVSFPLYVYGLHGILLMICAGIICVGFAAGDEYHQSFVAGRSASTRDIGIDSIGVMAGIIIVRMIGFAGRNTIFKPRRERQQRREMDRLRRENERLADALKEQKDRAAYNNRRNRQSAGSSRPVDTAGGPRRNAAEDRPRSDRPDHRREDTAERYRENRDERYYDNQEDRSYDNEDDRYYDDEDRYYDDEDERYYDDEDDRYYDDEDDRYYDDEDDRYYDDEDDDYYDDEEEDRGPSGDSSDDLSDDMPLSRLLSRRRRR